MKVLLVDNNKDKIEKMAELYKEIWVDDGDSIKTRFLRHSTYVGYTGMVVQNDKNEIVGFAYGYTSLPGQYYNSLIEKEFDLKEKQKWLTDCFELVELAVHSSYRKQGIGKILMTKLFEEVENETTLLTTQVDNKQARNLYESLDWRVLKEPFFPQSKYDPFVIIGKELV